MNRTHKAHPVMWLLLALAALLAIGGVFARYVTSREKTSMVTAREFYFTSDLLTNGTAASYTLNPDVTSFTFQLQNFGDSKRWSADPISYTVTVSGTGGATATVSPASGTIAAGAANSVTITVSGLTSGHMYTVNAVGTAGYVENLSATFWIPGADNIVYKHLDTSDPNYAVLTVWTHNVSGTASISYPNGLIPDDTDPAMTGWTTNGGSGSDTVSFAGTTFASHRYRFFYGTNTSPTVANFNVTVNGVTANESTP